MPLFYSAFDHELVAVQENALQRVPKLCELLDFSHIKDKLLPKLTSLFSKTKTLSIKVTSLICFHAMIPMLDKVSIVDVLLPTLGRIKTREPSVMVASLAVYEALCEKVDLETRATVFLPRLWVMAMCPLLNETQFMRFMRAIKDIGSRVEQSQLAHLREAKHLQLHTDEHGQASTPNVMPVPLNAAIASTGDINLEALVGHARYETSMHAMDDLFANIGMADAGTPGTSTPGASTPGTSSSVGISMNALLNEPSKNDLQTHEGLSAQPKSPKLGLFDALAPNKPSLNTSVTESTAPTSAMLTRAEPVRPSTNTPHPPGWSGGILVPEKSTQTRAPSRPSKTEWQNFDPLI